MPTWEADSTFEKVLLALKQGGGGLSVKDLCRRLGLSSMAVRRQLTLLEGSGLIYSEEEKRKTGRPVRRYYLTEAGHERFQRTYDELAIELLVNLRTSDGKEKVHDLFRRRKEEQLRQLRPRIVGKTLETRVHEVTQLLTEWGYMATWERLGPDRYLIKEMNCAVARVARKFPQTCICEGELLADLLQAEVTRQHHILQKDHYCSYLVERRPAEGTDQSSR